MNRSLARLVPLALAAILALAGTAATAAPVEDKPVVWSFAVSGDSRDCGDLVMPKIAAAVAAEQAPGIDLFWHLGDFRRMYDIDCDILKRADPAYDCVKRPIAALPDQAMGDYLTAAWGDFVEYQLKPFGKTPVLLGIGNHELMGRTREDFRRLFQPWLTQKLLHAQRSVDASHGNFTTEGDTSFHVVLKGVDLIYLDNADEKAFTSQQLVWLSQILSEDAKEDSIRTIVVGLHATLPFSSWRGHAMDSSCQGICSGRQAYDLLFRAQRLSEPPEKQKHVYVFSSHSHLFEANVYDTPEHRGQVLPGWIIGTAGAQQYTNAISYGYVRIDVNTDGTITPRFRPVTRTSPPATGPAEQPLVDFCFQENKGKWWNDEYKGPCACGAAAP
jgi:Calcineurin-like phosphoesterase